MPEELNNKGGAGGEGTGDGAGAGQGDGAGNGNGAGDGGAGQGAGGADEVVTIKKSELDQIISDRDNYKTGLLSKKADERSLDGKGSQGDGGGEGGEGDGQGGGAAVIDEKKIGEVATAATNKTLRAASERTAKRAFLKAHPEYVDDSAWQNLMAHLTFKGGEVTHEEIVDRMEAAVLEHKRSTGKLDEYLKSEHERGVREGRIQAEVGSGHGTGGAGDRNEGGKGAGTLSPKGEEMARSMHTDPEKVKKVDPSKDNVIDVTKV